MTASASLRRFSDEIYCLEQLHSLSAYYLDGALACQCSPLGSVSEALCAEYGGQCSCRAGVSGRACDRCQLDYFRLTALGCSRENTHSLLFTHISYFVASHGTL